MAVRDRNLFAWQAYVLVMSIVSVALLLALGWVIFNGSTLKKLSFDATTKARDLEQKLAMENSKQQYLMYMLGAKQATEQEVSQLESTVGAELDAVKKTYASDMALFGADVAPQDRNYSSLTGSLMKSLRTRNLQNDKASKDIERLTNEMKSVREQETKARKDAETERDRLAKELDSARDDYKKKESDLRKEIDQLNEEKKIAQANFSKKENDLRAQLTKMKDENDKLVKFKKQVFEEQTKNVEREDFESAQGKVVYVDQNGVIVNINLGRAQGLKTGLHFAVLPQDTLRVSEATPKAQIEIMKVYENQAQARVISDRKNVPVISNDLIYSPTWRPGSKVKIALVGKLDVNGDGADDRQLVKSLIEQNGGEIVEDVGPETKQLMDKMDIYTRYLVVGEMPRGLETKGGDPRAVEISTRYAQVRSRARELNVTEMSLEKLIGYLKKYDEDRTVGLGEAMRSDDFKERKGPVRSSLEGVRDTGIKPSGPLSGN